MEMLTPEQVAQSIRNPLFAKRDSLEQAFDHFFRVCDAVNSADRIAMITATCIVLNTIADILEPEQA